MERNQGTHMILEDKMKVLEEGKGKGKQLQQVKCVDTVRLAVPNRSARKLFEMEPATAIRPQ